MTLPNRKTCSLAALLSFALLFAGCSIGDSRDAQAQRERDERTREEVARATENAKPALQEAGKQIGAAAKVAAEDAKAAAQGVREGWERGANHSRDPLDINSASESDLASLPGISHRDARKIIAGRPYRDKHDLLKRGIITDDQYDKISDQTTAH